MRRPLLRSLSAAACLCGALSASPALANGIYSGKVSLTGFYYTESDGLDIANDPSLYPQQIASTSRLGYGELRTTIDARRVANDRIDFHLDVRLRFTGSFSFEDKFMMEPDNGANSLGTSARGYLGGSEYDLREAYVNIHVNDRLGIQLGRMFITEADNIKLDALRIWRKFGTHWVGAAFAGGYPNPYSRSLLTDYTPPCGAGVASDRSGPAQDACVTEGSKLGLGFGVSARYTYPHLWGSIALVGSVFSGFGDGGPVKPDPNAVPYGVGKFPVDPTQANLLPPDTSMDAPRIYVAWLNAWRPAERFDLFSDLVFDAYGSAGPQLTRLMILGTLRLIKDDRLTLRTGFSYMSSLAINMYLNRLVYNRLSGSTLTAQGISVIENNLTILRTGRAEARITLDTRFFRRLGAFVEGRFRYRTLIDGESDPAVYQDKNVFTKVPTLAGEAAVGIRDTGSVFGIRGGFSYSAIIDFLAFSHVISVDIGRDFWNERVGLTLSYLGSITKDNGVTNMDPCISAAPYPACFGMRSGQTHEIGLLATLNPWRTLFFIFDYRAIITSTDDQNGTPFPKVIGHAILGRTEFRW